MVQVGLGHIKLYCRNGSALQLGNLMTIFQLDFK